MAAEALPLAAVPTDSSVAAVCPPGNALKPCNAKKYTVGCAVVTGWFLSRRVKVKRLRPMAKSVPITPATIPVTCPDEVAVGDAELPMPAQAASPIMTATMPSSLTVTPRVDARLLLSRILIIPPHQY